MIKDVKKLIVVLVVLGFSFDAFADAPPVMERIITPGPDNMIHEVGEVISGVPTIEPTYGISYGPNEFNVIPPSDNNRTPVESKYMTGFESEYSDPSGYVREDGALLDLYNQEMLKYGNLTHFHEENYVYINKEHKLSRYNGIIGHVTRDFDGDLNPEMLIFRMSTEEIDDETALKRIIMDVARLNNGVAMITDSEEISAETYKGEEIDCEIGIKYVFDRWRIFINYYENRVLNREYENRFKAIDYLGGISTVTEISISANEDMYDSDYSYDYRDKIIDAGINVKEDDNILKRAFITDDSSLIPVCSIKRINERIKDNFIEDYIAEHPDELDENGYIAIRYGYTTITNRAR